MQTYQQWKADFKQNRPYERLGQAFVNDYIKGVWPELFYTNDEGKAQQMIMDYLNQMQYWPNMPEVIDREYQSIRSQFIYGN